MSNIKAKGISLDPSASWSGEAGEAGFRFDNSTGNPIVRKADGTEFAITAGGQTAPLVTPTTNGLARAVDKAKLDGVISVVEYGAVGNAMTDDTAAIQAAIDAAKASGRKTVFLPPGTYLLSSALVFHDMEGIRFVGSGPRVTTFWWIGSPSQTMIKIEGLKYSYIGGFSMIGDDVGGPGTQTAISYNAILGSVICTRNTFEDIFIERGFDYGIRVSTINYQVDQTVYSRCLFFHCGTAAVSIEDANAVLHHFYECTWTYNNRGITSRLNGTGGSFSLYGCGFVLNTGTNISTYPSSRGTVISGTWSEGDAVFLDMGSAAASTTVSMIDCSVNGSTVSGPHIKAGVGSLNIIGGKFTGPYPGSSLPFVIDGDPSHMTDVNINCIGSVFIDGNPFTGTHLTGSQIRLQGVHYSNTGVAVGDTHALSTPAGSLQSGRVFQGSGVPSSSDGNNGDIYFRTDTPSTANQRIYVKASGSWVGIA